MTGESPLGSRLHGHLKVSVSSLSCVRDPHSSPNKKSGLKKGFCSEKKYQKPLTERNGERHKRQASCLNTKTQLNGGKRRFFFSLSPKRRRRGKVSLWPGHWKTKKCLSNSQCGTYPFIVLGLAGPQPGSSYSSHGLVVSTPHFTFLFLRDNQFEAGIFGEDESNSSCLRLHDKLQGPDTVFLLQRFRFPTWYAVCVKPDYRCKKTETFERSVGSARPVTSFIWVMPAQENFLAFPGRSP